MFLFLNTIDIKWFVVKRITLLTSLLALTITSLTFANTLNMNFQKLMNSTKNSFLV